MVLHNPNNWHWVNKDARGWAQKYFEENLTVLTASSGETSVKVDKVVSVDGDVDVSQRKGKVITLFDVKMRLEFSGMIATIIPTIISLSFHVHILIRSQAQLRATHRSLEPSQSLKSPMTPKRMNTFSRSMSTPIPLQNLLSET